MSQRCGKCVQSHWESVRGQQVSPTASGQEPTCRAWRATRWHDPSSFNGCFCLQRFANRALRSGPPARAFTHLGLSGSDDFGSSGAGILGSSGLLGAGAVAGVDASVFSCGCSGLTLKREVDPACTWFAGCSALPPSAVESSSPARLPRLSAFSRLRLISCGCSDAQHVDGRILTPIGLGTVASMRRLPGGKAPGARAASTLTYT